MCEEYNGHKNRATWLVSMWLDGNYEQSVYYEVSDKVEHAEDGLSLAIELEEYTTNCIMDTLGTSGVANDLLAYLLATVDYDGIADDMLAERELNNV